MNYLALLLAVLISAGGHSKDDNGDVSAERVMRVVADWNAKQLEGALASVAGARRVKVSREDNVEEVKKRRVWRSKKPPPKGLEVFYSGNSKRAAIKHAKGRVEAAEAGIKEALENARKTKLSPKLPELSFIAVGDIGTLWAQPVVQIVDADNMRIRIVSTGRDLWVENFATEGHTHDSGMKSRGLFVVTGTRTYKTLVGSNTVLKAEPIDMDRILKESDLKSMEELLKHCAAQKRIPKK